MEDKKKKNSIGSDSHDNELFDWFGKQELHFNLTFARQ